MPHSSFDSGVYPLRIIKNILGFFLAVIAVLVLILLIRGNGFATDNFPSGTASNLKAMNGNPGFADASGDSDTASDLECSSAIAVDVDSGKTLYAKNIHEKLYPASLTKLMTALLLSEHDSQNDLLTYTARAKTEPSNKMNLPVGSKLTAGNAMKALLIFSANDIATMVAENVAGSGGNFADLMNKKAQSLGMKDTHFANAHGLTDSSHYTSAYDISVLAREVYKIPWIMDTMETPSALVKTSAGKGVTIYNTNKTLDQNGCFAGKTGNTTAAGWCLAAFYHHNGHTILGVVMRSPSEDSLYKDMRKLIYLT